MIDKPAVAPRETQRVKRIDCPVHGEKYGYCEECAFPAAAPTPVELKEFEAPCDDKDCTHPYCWSVRPAAAPAESQGVERAQPVEGPRCSICGGSTFSSQFGMCTCLANRLPAPVEGVERVTDDAPARVESQQKEKTMDLQAKYDKAMDLLSRAENRMDTDAPDANWLGEYYGLTGDHMILTEEGWTPGDSKPEMRPDDILMEVNAPNA